MDFEGVKERIDYPQLLFRQMDRISIIMSLPQINHIQLGRAVDALAALASFLGDIEYDATVKQTNEQAYYNKAVKTLENVIKKLYEKNLLIRATTTGKIEGAPKV